jgi:hypothetical protein
MIDGILGELVTNIYGMTFREVFGRVEIVGMEIRLTFPSGVTI